MCPCLLAVWLLASSSCESNFRHDSSLQFPFEQGGVLSRSARALPFVTVPGSFIAEDAVQNTVPLRDDSPVSLLSFSFHHLQVVMTWSPDSSRFTVSLPHPTQTEVFCCYLVNYNYSVSSHYVSSFFFPLYLMHTQFIHSLLLRHFDFSILLLLSFRTPVACMP